MKLLIFLLLIAPIHGSTYEWIDKELKSLEPFYTDYINKIDKAQNNTKLIEELDFSLSTQKPVITNYKFPSGEEINLPNFKFFNKVNPIGKYNPKEISIFEKKDIALQDRAKLRVFLFMMPLFSELYENLNKNKESKEKCYKKFFIAGEKKLLSLAQKSLKENPETVKSLSLEYNILIQELSKIPFPPQYSFYRRRMAYSIETPQAAQEEITRLKESLHTLEL